MNKHLIVITANGEITVINADDKLELEVLQSLVGGYIECVPTIFDQVEMLINEEGKLQGLKYNAVATGISRYFEYDMIVGDAVLCKICGDHLVGLSKTEAEEICDGIIRRLE